MTLPLGMLDVSLVVLLCAFAGLGWRYLRRTESGPAVLWVAAWAAAGTSILPGLAGRELPLVQLLAFPFGTLSVALLLAGALRLAERPIPGWLMPAALGFGLLRAGMAGAGAPSAAYLVSLPVDPLLLLWAAATSFRGEPEEGAALSQRLLGPCFVVLSGATAVHLLWMAQGTGVSSGLFAVWLAVGPPILGIQLRAGTQQTRQRLAQAYADLERRVEERTAELAAANAALAREVADRRAIERQLRITNERNRKIAELSSDYGFAFRIEPDGTIRDEWESGARARITGYASGEIEGAGWLSIIHPDDMESATQQFRDVRAGRRSSVEHRFVRKDGATRWLRVECTAVRSTEDGSITVTGAARDVTELKQAEAEGHRFEQHAQELQRLESLGSLAGGIAHDFNNLLSVIRGNARLALDELSEGRKPDGLARRLERIHGATEYAASLTDQMLAYARKSAVNVEPLDLSALVDKMEELLHATVGDHCVLERELASDLPMAQGDAKLIQQVLLNLVINASDSLTSSSGRVRIRTGRTELDAAGLRGAFAADDARPGRYVVLEVSDEGSGMDPETSRRIFEPFFTTKVEGRGLGMAAVLGIVQLHHGAIQLESELGRGSTFRVLLPAVEGPAPVVSRQSEARRPSIRGARILIADDDPTVLELGSEFLTREGFRVVSALGGHAAVEALRAEPGAIDAAVLDVAMPDLDGEKTLRELRAIRPDLPVVLVSGYDSERAAERFAESRLHPLLRKPYEPEDLTRCLRQAMAAEPEPG